jgi:hypothetical protein
MSVASRVRSSACEITPAKTTATSAATVLVTRTKDVVRRARRSRCSDVVVVEVEAHERLADAEAQDDAGEDDRRQQRLGVAELRPGEVVGVERQREQGQEPGHETRRLIREARGGQALDVALHGRGRYPVRRGPPG